MRHFADRLRLFRKLTVLNLAMTFPIYEAVFMARLNWLQMMCTLALYYLLLFGLYCIVCRTFDVG